MHMNEDEKSRDFAKKALLVLRPFFKHLLFNLILIISIGIIENYARPLLLRSIINSINSSVTTRIYYKIEILIVCYIIFSVLVTILYRLSEYCWLKINAPLKRSVGVNSIKNLFTNDISFFSKNFAGDVSSRIKDTMVAVPELILQIFRLISNFLGILFSLYALTTVKNKYLIILIIWIASYYVAAFFIINISKKLTTKVSNSVSKYMGYILDVVKNIKLVKVYHTQDYEIGTLKSFMKYSVTLEQKRDLFFIKAFIVQGIAYTSYLSFCFYSIIEDFKLEELNAGDFILIITINITVAKILWFSSSDFTIISDLRGVILNSIDVIRPHPKVHKNKNEELISVPENFGEINFINVSFCHLNTKKNFFTNLSLCIKQGERVGISGTSGSGKSTFISLLLKLQYPTSGDILFGGKSINSIKESELLNNIAYSTHEAEVFQRSIYKNLLYGNSSIDNNKFRAICKLTKCDDFVLSLAKGYDTILEGVTKLSGGQMQRLAIARSLMRNSKILILDEATSQLDLESERELYHNVIPELNDKTVIIVSHRVSAFSKLDRIIIFDKGEIVQNGSHAELINDNQGLYFRMLNSEKYLAN